MIRRWWARTGLIVLLAILGIALWFLFKQPLPNVFAVGIVGALLGCAAAVIVASFLPGNARK